MPVVKWKSIGDIAAMGSKKIGKSRSTGRPIVIDDNPAKRKAWAEAVHWDARKAMGRAAMTLSPCVLIVEFHFRRPKDHYKKDGTLKDSSPAVCDGGLDLDKLLRCIGDAMEGVVYKNDRQIYRTIAQRFWTEDLPHANIEVAWVN